MAMSRWEFEVRRALAWNSHLFRGWTRERKDDLLARILALRDESASRGSHLTS
jgi:hypothetical protein